jgi:hypothetical protein
MWAKRILLIPMIRMMRTSKAILTALLLTIPLLSQAQPGKANPFTGIITPGHVTDGSLVLFDGTSGKKVKDGGAPAPASAYTPPGAGAVATTQAEVNARTVSVFDFLTTAQKAKVLAGTTDFDSTAAVHAAIVQCSARGGGVVHFPSGSYAANIVLNTQGVSLEGESFTSNSNTRNNIVPFSHASPALTIGDGISYLLGGHLKNLSFYGEGPDGTGHIGILMPGGCQDWVFDTVSVRRFADYEWYITSGKVLTVNYPNEYLQFTNFHVSGGSGHTNLALIYMESGLSWVSAVSFTGFGIHGGVSEPAIVLDGVILWMQGGWVQCMGTGSGTNCVGIKLLKSGTYTPKVWGWNTVVEATGGGVLLEIYETTARKNVSLYVSGYISWSSTGGTGLMKSADTTTSAIVCLDAPKMPYLTELFQPRIVEEAWFAHSADVSAANASIKLTSANKLGISNGAAGTVYVVGLLGVGTTSPGALLHVSGVEGAAIRYGVSTASVGGGLVTNVQETTLTLTGASTATTDISVPTGSRLQAVQLRVDTTVTSDSGVSWSAAFSGGSTTAIAAAQAFTKDTKFSILLAGTEITTGTTQVTFTPNAGVFTAGVVHVLVYYETMATISNAP